MIVGLVAVLVALLLAAGAMFLVVRAWRRRVSCKTDAEDRRRILERLGDDQEEH